MNIHIKAIDERSPKSNKPLFEYWVDNEYKGKCSESSFEVFDNKVWGKIKC